jgi:hypothetical protein
MPLLENNQTRYIGASVRLDASTAELVDQYAAFVHASADDVVNKALNCVFSKDRDSLDFLKTPQAEQVGSRLRIRRGPEQGFGSRRGAAGDENCSRCRARELCTGNEGVILHSISVWSKNGASHRKNWDTPPLGGNCRETCECFRANTLATDRYRVPGFRKEKRVCLRKRGCREVERWRCSMRRT